MSVRNQTMSVRNQTMSDTEGSALPSSKEPRRADRVSAVAGLVFIATAFLALVDRLVTDVDIVIVIGAAVAAVGVAMIARVILRRRGSEQRDI